jgi:cell division protein FtsB
MKNKGGEKSKWSFGKILHSKFFLFFCLAIIFFLSVSVVKELLRKAEINRDIKDIRQQIAMLENNNEELNNLVDYLNSSSFQEKEVKSRLNMKETGEKVVFIPNDNKTNINYNNITEENETENSISEETDINNANNWWNYFFNKQAI